MPLTRQKDAARKRKERAAKADLNELSACANPKRRSSCEMDLRLALETYMPDRFGWSWSDDHLEIIAALQHVILEGGQLVVVCPRGTGKTTILEGATWWATAYGHRTYVVPVLACGRDATQFLDGIKSLWETNEAIAEDFPEIAEPIRASGGVTLRAKRLTVNGQPAHMEYSTSRIVYPWVDGAPGRGAIIEPKSIDGAIRGLKHSLPDGRVKRPDLALPDDLQTDKSAASDTQIRTRLRNLSKAVLGLGGPGKSIACIMLGTIIAKDDVVDQLLHNPEYHAWAGRRMQMIYDWPDAQDTLWQQYADIRRAAADVDTLEGKEAIYQQCQQFYLDHRQDMDAGAKVAWPDRYSRDPAKHETSALQHAENLLIDNGKSWFQSEAQNDPDPEVDYASPLTVDHILERLNNHPRWWMPDTVEHIAAKIDIGDHYLHLSVMAGESDGTPYLIHRQVWPSPSKTLEAAYPNMSPEARIYQGLDDFAAAVILPHRRRADGTEMKIGRLHVDEGHRPRLIRRWCRQGVASHIAHPEQGAKTSHTSSPLNQWRKKQGERRGDGWLIHPARNGVRTVVVDTHQWKTYLADRLQTPLGTPGALTLYGSDPDHQRDWAIHCTAEYPTEIIVNGNRRIIWKSKPNKPPEHYWDTAYGALTALSILGVQVNPGDDKPTTPQPAPRIRVGKMIRR